MSKDESMEKNKEAKAETGEEKGSVPLPQVTFSTFVLSLNTSALVHMGVLPEPGSGETVKDVDLAKHTIDTLAMLKEKTEGNLTNEEQALVDNILYDLRMRFVSLVKA